MSETYTVTYHIVFEDAPPVSYPVEIDRATLLSKVEVANPPAWTEMGASTCSNCTLQGTTHCPVALRLVRPLETFQSMISFKRASVEVVTEERIYKKEDDLQNVLRSLFGLIMATSGCPSMQPFRFMARHHLPFSTIEETIIRITSSYMLQQLFSNKPKISTEDAKQYIEQLFATMQQLNQAMVKRLKGHATGDSMVNAIVILNTNSSLIPIIVEEELMKLKAALD